MTVDYKDKNAISLSYGKLSDKEQEAFTDFDDLLDAYADAQRNGTFDDRVNARRALKHAFVGALRMTPDTEKS